MSRYGVLIGRVIETDPETSGSTPHYGLIIETNEGEHYEVKINVRSKDRHMPDLLYIADENYNAHAITILPTMNFGFHDIDPNNLEIAVDYIRSGLFNPNDMKVVPLTVPGESNDLNEFIDKYMSKAKKEQDSAIVYVYGMHYTHGDLGVHDVHMMQGNTKYQPEENGIYHDGCVLVHYTLENKWIAYFLAFQSQSWCTDDNGKPTPGSVDRHGNPIGECTHNNVKVALQTER
ncbi:YukJ family protein [Paenibacillus alvei]|uniref:YukJ family protein n=1 Tax=Paenibacillus alvei TaxID=44250 RepID=A0AAP7A1D3_PAEAL|nr:YukJ family protein [Paenibacillus alvei]NOJ73616.1 YukJ family protein [Paenibacillus alvei]